MQREGSKFSGQAQKGTNTNHELTNFKFNPKTNKTMFKFTVVRTDKKNVQHMKLLTIEDLLEKAGSDYIAKNVEPLREFAQYPEFMSRPSLSRLPVVLKAARGMPRR